LHAAAAAPAVHNDAEITQGSSHVAGINCFAAEYLGGSSSVGPGRLKAKRGVWGAIIT
jgi:hypothetical protein